MPGRSQGLDLLDQARQSFEGNEIANQFDICPPTLAGTALHDSHVLYPEGVKMRSVWVLC
jgi:hypothetical protein